MADLRQIAVEAAHAHTNLNVWAAVVAILESSSLYGPSSQHRAAPRVIAIAKREEQKFLRKYDAALAALEGITHG